MIELNVEFDKAKLSDVMRKVELLASKSDINKAINRAAKRAANTAKAETARQIPKEYSLPAAEVRKTIFTRSIGGGQVGAVMQISSSPYALPAFQGVTPRETMPPAKGPVRAQVKKGGGAELGVAFVTKLKSGHVGVFERKTEARTPLDQLFGPSTPGMFGREQETPVNTAVIEKTGEMFQKRVIHELEWLMYG
jgi:hypothetical protein